MNPAERNLIIWCLSFVCDKFDDGMAEKISDRSSGIIADDFYHRYKVRLVPQIL